VLGFDSTDPFFNQSNSLYEKLGNLKKVKYSEEKSAFTVFSSYDSKNVNQILEHLFFNKNNIWSYQKEWRIVRSLNKASKIVNDQIFLFNFPPSCIKEIILGFKMNKDAKSTLINTLSTDKELGHIILKEAHIEYINGKETISINPI
ncbi:MAG: DUF2971 domain-containing protein, partial [Lacibacter sp.]